MSRRGRAAAPPMSEAALEAAVLELAGLLGWKRAHFRPAVLPSGKWATHMAGDVGFPDLVLAKKGHVIVAELKSARGKVTSEQQKWLDVLGSVPGIEAVVWRPEDWRSGEIERALKWRDDHAEHEAALLAWHRAEQAKWPKRRVLG